MSHGSEENFSEEETIKWFHRISTNNPDSFLHIWKDKQIIGQLEFKPRIETSDGKTAGYINLFYLIPEFRCSGLGQKIHDYVLEQLSKDGCQGAMLRYIPGNTRAERFYIRNGV